MQYFRPGGPHFVGDCMPFSHNGRFHLFYLLDENHHQGLGGLGGHQWAHASTTDLIHWDHHPLALPIDADWEKSICTGSVFFHEGVYHAFYATRKEDYTQHLGHAVSDDGIHFKKLLPNPFASAPPGYDIHDLRDPFIFRHAPDLFHMIVTSRLRPFPLEGRGGCLLEYTSSDLMDWKPTRPMLVPGGQKNLDSVPECPDYFLWKGWHYLLFGLGFETCYRMSREPFGPWSRPAIDMLDNRWNAVIKTAAFGERRIAAGWIGERRDGKDGGQLEWGGNVVFRELVQNADGTLGTSFVEEMVATTSAPLPLKRTAITPGATVSDVAITLSAPGQNVAVIDGLPRAYHFRCRLTASNGAAVFGFRLRAHGDYGPGYDLAFDPARRTLSLADTSIILADDMYAPIDVRIIVRPDLIDVCINNRQCMINRLHERGGNRLFLFGEDGVVRFEGIEIKEMSADA